MGALPGVISQAQEITGRWHWWRHLETFRLDGPRRRYLRDVALLVVAYYAAAHLGYALQFSGPVAAIVWLPVGVGISFLYLRGMRFWPGVLLGDLLVNNYSTLPLGSAVAQSAGNVAEVILAAMLLRRLSRRGEPLRSLAGVARMLVAILAGTLLSATVGSLSSWAGGVIATNSLPYVWRTWWLGDLTGALIVLPLALSWSRPPHRPWRLGQVLEASLTMVAVTTLGALSVLGGGTTGSLVFPALIWGALRFGSRGATLAITITAGWAIWGTTHDFGPFAVGTINSRLLETQLFIAIVSLSGLSIAALGAEREQLAENVRASRARVVAASDEERRRLERDLHDGAQQRLVVIAARLASAAEQAHQDNERAALPLDAAQADVQTAIAELRELARGMHPSVLRDLGLARAIKAVAAKSTLPIELVGVPRTRLGPTSEATAYYVALEAVTNAQKHSGATRLRVSARLRHRMLLLEVRDDGIGGACEHDGSGLEGLRDRVEATGGRFTVHSKPGHGTTIAAEIPVSVVPAH